jgi:hypothetical protein
MDLELNGRVVVLAGNDTEERTACERLLTSEGATVHAVADLARATGAVEGLVDAGGPVDAVVICLPRSGPTEVLAASLDDLYGAWTSLEAAAGAFGAAAPRMMERGWGRLITVMSSAVKALDDSSDELGAMVGLAALGMNKAAVADLARHGVAVNAVLRSAGSAPDEVAATVAFLLSGGAGYLQGVTISLDGAASPAMY